MQNDLHNIKPDMRSQKNNKSQICVPRRTIEKIVIMERKLSVMAIFLKNFWFSMDRIKNTSNLFCFKVMMLIYNIGFFVVFFTSILLWSGYRFYNKEIELSCKQE